MPILLPTLTTQFGESLGMSMTKTQSTLNGRCATRIASLRLSFAPFLAPVFRAFLRLKLDRGTLRRREQSLLPRHVALLGLHAQHAQHAVVPRFVPVRISQTG